MTRSMTRLPWRFAGAMLALILLSGVLLGCGRYGPPTAYPPGVEAQEDEEQK